ncbi:hypothetical protein U1Q18_045123 [Sarracenia purpurea var. burkii]
MPLTNENVPPAKLQGKYAAMVGVLAPRNGCLFSWNSMLTIEDYYGTLFPRYHPSRAKESFGYTLFFISTLLVLVLDLATSGKGGIGTFIGICLISGAFGVADAHVQGGMVGDLSFMLPEFIQSFLAGLAASGVLTSGLRLITKAAFENSKDGLRKGANLFFAISTFFELLCVLLYAFVLPKLQIIKYYRSKAASEGSKTVSADLTAGGICTEPGQELESRRGITIAVLSRFLLVPAFYFTAKYGDQGWMIMLTSFLGLSNGYLTVCVLTSAPKGYKGPEQNALGNILVLFLLGGIFAGVTLDWLWLIGKVLREIEEAKKEYPESFIRIIGFDNRRQV